MGEGSLQSVQSERDELQSQLAGIMSISAADMHDILTSAGVEQEELHSKVDIVSRQRDEAKEESSVCMKGVEFANAELEQALLKMTDESHVNQHKAELTNVMSE